MSSVHATPEAVGEIIVLTQPAMTGTKIHTAIQHCHSMHYTTVILYNTRQVGMWQSEAPVSGYQNDDLPLLAP